MSKAPKKPAAEAAEAAENPDASKIVWIVSQLPVSRRREINAAYAAAHAENETEAGAYGDWLLKHHGGELEAWQSTSAA